MARVRSRRSVNVSRPPSGADVSCPSDESWSSAPRRGLREDWESSQDDTESRSRDLLVTGGDGAGGAVLVGGFLGEAGLLGGDADLKRDLERVRRLGTSLTGEMGRSRARAARSLSFLARASC